MNKLRRVVFLMLVLSFAFSFLFVPNINSFSHAASSDIGESVLFSAEGATVKKVDLGELTSRIETKINEVIVFMRRVSLPFAVLSILMGLMMIVIGAVTGSKMKNAGVLVVIFVIIAYMGIVFAPAALRFLVKWVSA